MKAIRFAYSLADVASAVLLIVALASAYNVAKADTSPPDYTLACGYDRNKDICSGYCVAPTPRCDWTSPAQIDCNCQK